MAGKHTSGPWIAEFETVGNGGWRESDDVATIYCGEKIIATYSVSYREYPESRDENEANARLIAAAPDYAAWAESILARGTHRGTLLLETEDVIALQAIHARATQPLPPPNEDKP